MLNKKTIALSLAGIILFGAGGMALKNHGKEMGEGFKEAVSTIPIVNKKPKENIKKETLTCFDFVDQSLQADGLTHLGGTYWGRGEKNLFILDVSKQEFYLADSYETELPEDWYKTEFKKYVQLVYRHALGEVSVESFINTVPNYMDFDRDAYTNTKEELADVNNGFYEFPRWMNHYVAQAEKYGCPLNELSEEKLLGEYKTKMSKASEEDVLSSFDLTSDDGVIRYFKDVFTAGDIQRHPRFKEITNLSEYAKLDEALGWEAYYMTNIIYRNPEKYTFERDADGLSGSVLEHFVKDVVFPNTHDPSTGDKIPTIGVYFIYADNPNFKYIYIAPLKNSLFSNVRSGSDMSKFIMPYDATAVYSNKGMNDPYKIYPYGVGLIKRVLEQYLVFIKELNPNVEFSEDFIRNYTRPFDINWQRRVGLSDFFDSKYGLINREVKYLH